MTRLLGSQNYLIKSMGLVLLFCLTALAFYASQVYAQPKGGLPECRLDLDSCYSDLDLCNDEDTSCEAVDVLPGDGYENPDSFGVSGHGPQLTYTNNEDGTFTDEITGLMWEIKLSPEDGLCTAGQPEGRSVHCQNNDYRWTNPNDANQTNPDGSLFMVFLDTLNNKCDGDEAMVCTNDADCGANGPCGFAGHRDWRIPNIKELQSIVNYTLFPSSSVPGATSVQFHCSATTSNDNNSKAWGVYFSVGSVNSKSKSGQFCSARAVRP